MKIMGLLLVLLMLAGAGIVSAILGRRLSPSPVVSLGSYTEPDIADQPDKDSARNGNSRYRAKDKNGPESEEWLTRFELIERSGELVSSDDLRGQPYVVGFFFTLCPSICVNQNAKVEELQQKFFGKPIRLLSISCDPEVDRPEVLAEYAKRFHADPKQWLFLTGDMSYITRVAGEMYFLAAERRFHAEKFVLVDADGKNVGFYTWSDPLQFSKLERDIEKLLSSGGVMPDQDRPAESAESQ